MPLALHSFRERLAWSMREATVSQSELARRAGCRQGTIEALLSGRSKATTKLAEIALALDVSAIWLATGRGGPRPWKYTTREARMVAQRFDQLERAEKDEVIGYLDYIVTRRGTSEFEPLRALLENLSKSR